jgi:hypothetical protein
MVTEYDHKRKRFSVSASTSRFSHRMPSGSGAELTSHALNSDDGPAPVCAASAAARWSCRCAVTNRVRSA